MHGQLSSQIAESLSDLPQGLPDPPFTPVRRYFCLSLFDLFVTFTWSMGLRYDV
jgi:hypothetical protein